MANRNSRVTAGRDLGDGRYGVWTAYENRERCKALPGSRWDPTLKCWWVPIELRAEAERLIAALNGVGSTLGSALVDLFAALPDPLRGPTYRALAKAWHPDTGGDLEATQVLTEAWREMAQ